MKIARYWVKATAPAQMNSGRTVPVLGWGWSETSREEALQRAEAAAQRSASWLESKVPAPVEFYGEYDRPPREEILREIPGDGQQTFAVITRNSYGVQVLNTQNLMFIDVDIPAESAMSGISRSFGKLFGRVAPSPEETVLKRVREAAARHSQHTFRIYRTAAGFRCLLSSRPVAPEGSESQALLNDFGADRLYVRLCRTQECYRARLSPKFWRCGARRPPGRFPWDKPEEEQRYRKWESEYEQRCQRFATCRFVEQIGRHPMNAELQALIELHDTATKAGSTLPLA